MTVLAPFPDIEKVVRDIVEPLATPYTELPTSFPVPAVRITRTGGRDDGVTDYPTVEITTYGSSRAEAWEVDGLIRQRVLASGATAVNNVVVDFAKTVTPTQQLPDPREDIRVVTSSYRFGLRRPSPLRNS